MDSALKRCKRCLLPETHESITFNESGICNICLQNGFKKKNIDWTAKKKELDNLIERHRGKYDYDCIIPFSGGKDSTWTLYYLIKEYKLKPLVVRFDHGFLRPNLNENTTRVLRELGADFISFTPNWKIVQKLMLQSFLEKGDFCWHCHTGIFSYPMHIAIKFNVPLIFWGEPSAEYTAYYGYDEVEKVDEERFNRFVNLGINAVDMAMRIGQKLDKRDFIPYTYPKISDLKKIKYESVCLGSYIPWDVKKQSQIIMEELLWKGDDVENVPKQYNYEKIECYMQGVRDYIKYLKRGYTRPTHLAAIDLRNQRINEKEAKEMINSHEGKEPPSLEIFLKLLGISKDEFYEIANHHRVSPWKFKSISNEVGIKLDDFDKWSVDGQMNPEESKKQINFWKMMNE